MKNPKTNEDIIEYTIEKYKFIVENKFAEKGRKIDDILIDLAIKDIKKTQTYCKMNL